MDALQNIFATKDGIKAVLNKNECPQDGQWHSYVASYTKEKRIMEILIDGKKVNEYCPLFNRRL